MKILTLRSTLICSKMGDIGTICDPTLPFMPLLICQFKNFNIYEEEIKYNVFHEIALILGTALLITPLIVPAYRTGAWMLPILFFFTFGSVNTMLLPMSYLIAAGGVAFYLLGVYAEYKKA